MSSSIHQIVEEKPSNAAFDADLALKRHSKQLGAAPLLEIAVATMLGILIAVFGIPYVQGMLIENKVPTVAQELQRFVASTRTMAMGGGATPYTDVTTAQLANALSGMRSNVFTVAGTGTAATVTHDIGASGAATALAAGTLETAGDSMQFTLSDVALAGCVPLAQIFQAESSRVTINGTVVKTTTGGVIGRFSLPQAQTACTAGDTNDLVFLVR